MARNSKLNQQMKNARREQILEAGLKLFAHKGLAATKITDIARASGMSQGLLYHYYQSKEDIYTELVDKAFDRLIMACQWLEAQPMSPKQKLDMAISSILENLDTSTTSPLYHLLVLQATVSDAVPQAVKEIINEKNKVPYEMFARIIAQGQEQGDLHNGDPLELAQIFWITVKGVALHIIAHKDTFTMPDKAILSRMICK